MNLLSQQKTSLSAVKQLPLNQKSLELTCITLKTKNSGTPFAQRVRAILTNLARLNNLTLENQTGGFLATNHGGVDTAGLGEFGGEK